MTPTADRDRAGHLNNLGGSLRARFDRSGDLADIDEAIAAVREALALTPADHLDRAMYLANLGDGLQARFRRAGDLADLEEAVSVSQQATAATAIDDPQRARRLANLAGALRARFDRSGDLADIDEAVTASRDAVNATPDDDGDRASRLSILGAALRARFGRTGDLQDLDQAVMADREAVAATPIDHPKRGMFLAILGNALQSRSGQTGDRADLDEAVTAARDAVAATPTDQPGHALYLSNLGGALQSRFDQTGDRADLDEAVMAKRSAVAATPTDHTDRGMFVSNLGLALQAKFELAGNLADLDEAISFGREAVAATPTDHPNCAVYLGNLGNALEARFGRSEDLADLDEGISVRREAARSVAARPSVRVRAARAWGRLAAAAADQVNGELQGERTRQAVEGYAAAIELLPLVAWRGLDRSVAQKQLEDFAGLAGDATAWAIAAGQPQRAVELLEAGRSVLWAQALQTRTDLTRLRETAPDLVKRMDHVRATLDAGTAIDLGGGPPPRDPIDIPIPNSQPLDPEQAAQRRRRMAEEWDNLVTQARTIKGFEDFLAPTPFDRLRPAADAGPVVLVNTSSYRCDALILTPATSGADPVQVVELPDLTLELSIERAAALLVALYSRVGVRRALTAITGWLWDTVAGPVLNHLGRTGTPGPGEPWPRMWWCPTGPLTLLPLHAAGHHNDREACVPDRVVSSYTPTLTALIRARSRPAPIHRPRLLAVGMPETPGHAPLPGVTVELDRIHTQIPITTRLQQPRTQATIQAVLAALPEHEWVHFACHAEPATAPSSDTAPDPSQSAIRLQDGPLTVQRIAECNLPAADLAYLSACQTAFGGTQLLDEAIHLAAALQLIGYRHVIATLWSISDQQAPNIAEAIYTHLTHPGTPSPDRAAQALHQALSTLRRQHPDTIIEWAAYLHTGP